jgi:glycolate oxidase iron-sulfur subunit
MAAADELVEHVPSQFLLDRKEARPFMESAIHQKERDLFVAQQRGRAPRAPDGKSTRPKIALMPVCGSQYLRPETGLATLKLLNLLNLDFSIPDLICCGLPGASYGVLERVRAMAQENITRLERGRFEAIVSDDSSCTAHIKEYPKYFVGDQGWSDKAYTLAGKVRELSSFLIQWGLLDKLKAASWSGGAVAYHDPCKAQYSQKVVQPPREILSAIKGVKLVPVNESDQCCGGGGTYSFVHAEMSRDVLSRKVKNIIDSQCRVVVTSSASCQMQLAYGLRQQSARVEVLHLSEFLVRALNLRD